MRTPLDDLVIGQRFGPRVHPITGNHSHHNGQDFPAPTGTPIKAIADGVVTAIGSNLDTRIGAGHWIRITHRMPGRVIVTDSWHMRDRATLKPGSLVREGHTIGYVGSTGASTGPHLHFETRENGVLVDPLTILPATTPAGDGQTEIIEPEEDPVATLFYRPIGNSTPLKDGTSRIWAGTRDLGGILYADVWAVADHGEGRRLTRRQWEDLNTLANARGLELPVIDCTGNQLEQIIYAPRY